MHPALLAQVVADHNSALVRQAAAERLLAATTGGRSRPPRRHPLGGWHLQSPLTRRAVAAPCP
jgi:hypothetical protein